MIPGAEQPALSLRERKAKRTRAQLVDEAVRLCLKVGYEQTTVEMIAAAADVSPRTFTRYFATKEAVFLAVLDPVTDQLIVAVREQPDHLGPLEALRAAYVEVFTRIADRPLGQPSADQVAVMLRVVNSVDGLNERAMAYRHRRMRRILEARPGPPLDDRTADFVVTLFNATMVTAFGNLVSDTDVELLGPRLMVERLNAAFADLVEFTADLSVPSSTLLHRIGG